MTAPTTGLPAPTPPASRAGVWAKVVAHKKILIIGGVVGLVLVLAGLVAGWLLQRSNGSATVTFTADSKGQRAISQSDAVKAGKALSNNRCEGEGVPYKLSISPMKAEDFTHIIPYGLMVGGHVTPIDHQYFSPADYRSPRDAYEVRAMADSRLVDIQTRTNNNPDHPGNEYRLVFTVSCTFLYYYDLVTSLSPDIQAAFDQTNAGEFRQTVDIPVKAGQVIGKIGGRTLDFAVWDTTKPLSGFVVPEQYEFESWKIYTADPLDYYTDELKQFLLSKYNRTTPPISGKIDYDIDGKLIGNWFEEGSNGYKGTEANRGAGAYWKTHLSISPNHYDPSQTVVSMGFLWQQLEYEADMQHMVVTPAPNPADVGVETGLTKYDLSGWEYYKGDGTPWDGRTFATGITAKTHPAGHFGCALAQLTETRKLKFELLIGKACADASDFTAGAKTYTR